MTNNLSALRKSLLFTGLSDGDIDEALKCLSGRTSLFDKNECLLMTGDEITAVGVVLEGSAHIVKEDMLGNRAIVDELSPGDMFAEAIVCAGIKKSPVTIFANTPCKILFIELKKIMTTCSTACGFHMKLIENLLTITARKNIFLNRKIDILSKKTIREKLLAYFAIEMQKAGKAEFDIPFSRDELADYICANRSAMSRELSAMRAEGLLTYQKNHFRIEGQLL